MQFQQRFHTETKAHSHSITLPSAKFDVHSALEHDTSKVEPYRMLKYLTVKIHEAKLLIDVSIFGKMTTFAQVKLGNLTWKTSVDKEGHMEPQWNESKTFEVKNLGKYFKNSHKTSGSMTGGIFSTQQVSNNDQKPAQSNDASIVVGIYDHAFFHDMLIGEISISLKDILNSKSTGDYYIHNEHNMVGTIRITHKFEYGDEDVGTLYTQETASINKFSSPDSRYQSGSYNRVPTEPTEAGKSTGHKPLFNHRNLPSNYSGHPSEYDPTTAPTFPRIMAYQSADLGHHYPQQFGRSNQRPEFSSHDLSRPIKKPLNVHPYKRKSEEKEYETLVTYENYNEGDSDEEKQMYDDFFNNPSSEGRITESSDQDLSDYGMDSEIGEEGERFTEYDDGLYELLQPNMPLPKQLEILKKINIELKNRMNEKNARFEEMKKTRSKLRKEQKALNAKNNELLTREECLKNEQGNLAADFLTLKREEEELAGYGQKIREYKAVLKQARQEEQVERRRQLQLQGEIRQEAESLQKETQNLKQLEQDMYKKLIALKIERLNQELDEESNQEDFNQESNSNVPAFGRDEDDEREVNADNLLEGIKEEQSGLENEIQSRLRNIERLRELLASQSEEEIAE